MTTPTAYDTATDAPVLVVDGLTVAFTVEDEEVVAVDHASFTVGRGEVVAVVGESGSGKSMTAMTVMGIAPEGARTSGAVRLGDLDVVGADEPTLRRVRGRRVSMIFQDPMAALNPVFSIGFQLAEAVRRADPGLRDRDAVRVRCVELLRMVEVPDPEHRIRQYPHELSGGQCQRVMIAMALAADPDLLIADEPTTALDVTVQAEVLDVLRRLRARTGASILLITHDMGVVADLADRVVVMRNGRVVETGDVADVFHHPAAEYTRELLAAVPRMGETGREAVPTATTPVPDAVLAVRGLVVEYGSRLRGRFRAVDDVTFTVGRGEIVGLVGESGSGKTTIGRAAVGLAPITAGTVTVVGTDVGTARRADRRAMRRRVGVVFQNPMLSLNPRYTVAQTIAEPLRHILGLDPAEVDVRVDRLLTDVGLGPGWRHRYPHELSGGQRQRIAIARAVALDPALLIADEPTSALDVSVQARVLDVFRELQERLGFACLFVTHDLAVVDSLCDRVVVLNHGRLVESGTRERILRSPEDAYTRRLIAAAPVPDPVEQAARREARLAS
ncbi:MULTISPECIES: ABC transporter ATP-binding protein [unclassified Curtobacterium]|uniref:dipeptide ABC transporter ATP-binding protein n=1 Tax=unclassified Curtobacterium TaxID=257496 RepID=UPI000DAA4BE2|nr:MULTISPECIES: ABC transporter ATP-binding protein [unclassified Curtobacterium]PZE78531.1 glutathione ABC transporter ATP-binding protein [Curtobacterium sp. MCBD17_019]WIB64353.1 ABC transporter ATP-binding protein [Curtobacterium sp. MCBD17_040]